MTAAYEKLKPSGVEWLGVVPTHWAVKRLKLIGEVIIGITYSPSDISQDEKGLLVLRSSNIQNGMSSQEDNVYVDLEVSEKHITKLGDILLCARNGSADLVGKNIFIDKNSMENTFGAFMSVFRTKYSRYIYWYFNSVIFTSQKSLYSTTTINQLTSGILNNMYAALPPEVEQNKITSYLDSKISKIDSLIESKESQVKKLKEIRQIEINTAVTKGLDPNAKLISSGIEWFGNIPEDWLVKRLKKIVTKLVDYRGKTPDKTVDGIILITARNVKNGSLDFSKSEEYIDEDIYDSWMVRGLPKKGDLLFTTEAPLGEVALIENENVALAQRIILFKMKDKVCSGKYLKYFIMSNAGQYEILRLATGSTAPGIKGGKLPNIRVIIPPISEQSIIENYLEKRTSKIDMLIKNNELQIDKLNEIRKIEIYNAVTGKIKVA